MIGESQYKSRSHRKNILFGGCGQRQFDHYDPVPNYSRGFHHGGGRYLPHQTSGPTIPIVAPLRQLLPVACCEICDVKLSSDKNMEQHRNGKRHQRMLKLHEESKRQKTINGQKIGQMPNSLINLVVQPKTVQKFEKNGCLVRNVSSEGTIDKHKDYLQKDIGKTSEVAAEEPKGKSRDNFAAQGHGFKRKIRGARGCKYMKTNNGIRRPMESSKPDVNALSNYVESQVQMPTVAPPLGSMASQIVAPAPVVGSSFKLQFQHVSASQKQVSEGKAHHEIQNPTGEKNDQPRSISVELHAPAGSSINTQTEDVSSDSAAIAIAPPQGPIASQVFAPPPAVGSSLERQIQHVLHTESEPQASEAIAHYENQNPTDERNIQLPSSVLMESNASAGSCTNTQTANGSSDSAAIATAPPQGPIASQVFAPPPTVGSSFEPQIQHVLHNESEPQVSKAIAHHESQNPTDEINIQLPSSVLVEFDAPEGSSTNTQTTDESSKDEEKMDLLSTKSGITQLSQVTVCLACGDKGFPETLVFCNKCQVYALHRYCLDGPVIFVEDVTWFCEDCEAKVVDTSSPDQSTPLPSGTSDSVNLAKDAIQARIEQTNCIKRVKENKQWQQTIVAETKLLLPDSHSLSHREQSQCSNNCEEENKSKKECQPVSKDAANSGEGSVTVQNSQLATNDLNFVELDGHVDAQPISEPIWRGSLYLCNQIIGNVSGLLAHLSNLACSKALEETILFPEVLCVELLQRSAVWPKSFKNCGPTDQSIALYLFPENERAEKAFDKLVDDIIYQDLAMRTVVENAELLVFPSTVLPIQCRRFQAKYYLWGVFRAKQTSTETNDVLCEKDTGVDKPLTRHNHSPSKSLRNSGSSGSSAQSSCASGH